MMHAKIVSLALQFVDFRDHIIAEMEHPVADAV